MRDGTRFAVPSLVLQARQREPLAASETDLARFGFTASKTIGNAVARNRARRRLKEAVRLIAPGHARQDYDYVLIARAGTLQRHFTDLTRDLERALHKVHQTHRP